MAGRRLLDAAKLFNASKSVAQKHVNLRSQQLEVYARTSSLAKALKNQTDRITLTAQAAIALSQRFTEQPPPSSYTAPSASAETWGQGAPENRDSAERTNTRGDINEGFKNNSATEEGSAAPVEENELPIKQEEAERIPLPDGTIPVSGSTLEGPEGGRDTFSQRPTPEPPKEPLVEEQHKGSPGKEGLKPVASAASTIPVPTEEHHLSPEEARKLQWQSESHIPLAPDWVQHAPQSEEADKLLEGHDQDLFYTRNVEQKPEYSSLPRAKIPRHTEDHQEGDSHVDTAQINQEVYYSTPKPGQVQEDHAPHKGAIAEEETLPEGINLDGLFHTRRGAQLLGGNPYARKPSQSGNPYIPKPSLDLKGTTETPHDNTKLAEGKDQDTFNVRSSEQTKPTTPEIPIVNEQASTDNNMYDLAAGLTTDVEAGALPISDVTPEAPIVNKQPSEKDMHDFAARLATDVEAGALPVSEIPEVNATPYKMRESRVPSSRLGRFWQYAGLGTSMAMGAVGESLRRVTGSAASTGGSLMLSPANIELLVAKLSRMRGAALKLGQMISIQDMKMLPPAIHEVLQRVQDSADYMPASQRNKVLAKNLGPDWRELFDSFDEVPIAAASIGQVHKAILRSTGQPVAVKVQYPGVSSSIDSDLNNLSILLTASRLLPKGLYLDKTIANARTELSWECDYVREAACQTRFRNLLADDTDAFTVPAIIPEACGPQVLTAELMYGIGVAKLPLLSQSDRDWIGTQILRLCLREIVEFKFMQTDPNWTNFLYNKAQHKIELLDFGASREYPEEFVDPYVQILIAASQGKKDVIRDLSIQLGYLTGDESQMMLEAHLESVITLAEPFKATGPEVYDFRDQTITDRVRSLIPVMIKERLSPPPEETYSLHRKLSGAFLLCARLGSRVACREMFKKAVETWGKGRKGGGGAM